MKQLTRVSLLLPVALMLVLPVHATEPSVANGTFFPTQPSIPTLVRTAGTNAFFTATGAAGFAGDIQGSGPTTGTLVLHNSTGLVNVKLQMTFTGTVENSQPGTMTVTVIGVIDTTNGQSTGVLGFSNGTGGLEGIHGTGTITGTPLLETYSTTVHIDPS